MPARRPNALREVKCTSRGMAGYSPTTTGTRGRSRYQQPVTNDQLASPGDDTGALFILIMKWYLG
ncbi:hypothetical protein F7734_53620 [Scytonema sp. UIC 10036]|uniref:hypothetical protein n=1 Tax=Scytonema sp. UIC 10036 TaxID=2304196 RepID=UPI0012DA249D|nr:hypothetical protein [Scytonema sp. UIC 10036]MUH00648.1 hypothetical protein [Scytonema sp. UIC 10036]